MNAIHYQSKLSHSVRSVLVSDSTFAVLNLLQKRAIILGPPASSDRYRKSFPHPASDPWDKLFHLPNNRERLRLSGYLEHAWDDKPISANLS